MQLNVTVTGGRLKIRLPKHLFDGNSKDFYLGLADSPMNIARAERLARIIEEDISREQFDKSLEKYRGELDLPAADCFDLWLQYRRSYWDEATFKIKQYLSGELRRFFLDQTSISFRDAVAFSQCLLRSHPKPDTFNRKIDTLRKAWEWMLNMDLASENPWVKIDKLRDSRRRKHKPKPFSKEEIAILLDAFSRDYPQLLPFIKFMLGTGCRIGEAIGLRWGDISWDCSKVFIRSQLVDGRLKPPKCDSEREFFLPASLVFVLRELNRGRPDDFVFTVNGHAIDRRSFLRRTWKPLLQREGIAYRKPSALRHNFCSWLLHGGISVIEAAKITGHDPKVLLDSYADVVNDTTKIPDLFSE